MYLRYVLTCNQQSGNYLPSVLTVTTYDIAANTGAPTMPKKTYALKIDPDVLTRIATQRDKWGVGMAEFIRRAIEQGLKQWEAARGAPPW